MTLVYFPGVPAPGVYFPGVHFARVPQDADRRPKSSCWGGQTDPVTALDDLMERAANDADVRGVILTGSHARGMATAHSDYDVIVVIDAPTDAWRETTRTEVIDEIIYTVAELADTSPTWQRYAFRGARVLLDRLDGGIADLARAQATPTEPEARAWAAECLDAYINQAYRTLKSRRDGRAVEARLDEMETAGWFLATLFPLYGRLRPYNKYVRWELATYPLGPPWDAETLPERVAADPVGLFADIEAIARDRGHGAIVDAWAGELAVFRCNRPLR
jgi:predicted nucleotidyltransferase